MASMLRRAAKLALQEEAGELTDAMKEITDTLGPMLHGSKTFKTHSLLTG